MPVALVGSRASLGGGNKEARRAVARARRLSRHPHGDTTSESCAAVQWSLYAPLTR